MITVEPCTIESVADIDPQESQAGEMVTDALESVTADTLAFWSRTILEDGKPIAAMGCFPVWGGHGQAWAWISLEAIARRPVALTRITRRLLNEAEEVGGFRRIQATVSVEVEEAARWAEVLGFDREGCMRNYGPGGRGDFYLYARCIT